MNINDFTSRVLSSQHKLYRFALRMLGSVQEAEDVVQEVLAQMWDQRQMLPTLKNAEAWCMRIVKNRSLDKLKARHNQPHMQVEDISLTDIESNPSQRAEYQDTMDRVQVLLDTLPQNQKIVIQLRDIEGYSYQEIAEITELPLSQIKINLFRARKFLRKQLIQQETFEIKDL